MAQPRFSSREEYEAWKAGKSGSSASRPTRSAKSNKAKFEKLAHDVAPPTAVRTKASHFRKGPAPKRKAEVRSFAVGKLVLGLFLTLSAGGGTVLMLDDGRNPVLAILGTLWGLKWTMDGVLELATGKEE